MSDAKMFWKVQKELCKDNLIGIQAMGDDEFLIALVFEPDTAKLIAAAPELLEALKESLILLEASYLDWAETPYESQNSNGDVIFEVKERVKEVIAKATGEQK